MFYPMTWLIPKSHQPPPEKTPRQGFRRSLHLEREDLAVGHRPNMVDQ